MYLRSNETQKIREIEEIIRDEVTARQIKSLSRTCTHNGEQTSI